MTTTTTTEPEPEPTTNRGAALLTLARSIVAALPPPFLMLVLLNVMFLAAVMWFLSDQTQQRVSFATRTMDTLERFCRPPSGNP